MRPHLLALCALLAAAFPAAAQPHRDEASKPTAAPVPRGIPTTPGNCHLPTEGEIRLGRESAAEVEKHYKIFTSGPQHERLQKVAADVVQAIQSDAIIRRYRETYHLPRPGDTSRRLPFEFSFKVIDLEGDVNAFSLAGGPVYVSKALLEFTQSDHELAAVLAHECAHVAYHHVEQLVKKQRRQSTRQLFALIATVIAGAVGGGQVASAATNVMMASQLISIATLTGYGRELEHEADSVGVAALASTRYHPAGMLTFMQKLARQDRLRGFPNYGIYQSHPYANERVAALKSQIARLGYDTSPGALREASGAFVVTVAPTTWNGRPASELRLNGSLLYLVVAGEGDMGQAARAAQMADSLNHLFREAVGFNDVRQSADKLAVLLRGRPVIRVQPDDAAAAGSAEAAADRAYREIIKALWKEKLDREQ